MTNQNSPTGPVRRQRMAGYKPAQSEPAAPAEAAAPTQEAKPQPVRRQRMGAPAATPAAPEAAGLAPSPAPSSAAAVPPASPPAAPPAKAPPAAARPTWMRHAAITAGLLVLALVVVLAARWLRTLDPVQEFLATYDGHASQPDTAPVGLPAWLGWQHFFNMFFIVLIVRTGWQIRTERKPPGYWTARKDSFFSPKGNTPRKVSLTQWLHQTLDVLWVVNGLVFVILLFATGQWMRIVPTSWDIFPNMLSTGLQYASLDWPTENGWVHYNALQVVAYFSVVFLAAPLAILSGIRMSTWWPEKAAGLSKAYPVEWARAVHVPVMLYFVAFTVVHVFLVFFTGALRNLNHMFASRDAADWWGLAVFLVALAVIAAGWFLTKPLFTTAVAGRVGKVSK